MSDTALNRGGSNQVTWQELAPAATWREVVLWAKFTAREPGDLMAEAWSQYYDKWKREQA